MANESPVQGQPDDLLLLAGYGLAPDDMVMYRAIRDTTQTLSVPTQLPAMSDADVGLASIVSTGGTPYSLVIRLPVVMRADQSYALWVRSSRGEWSLPIKINDARPLWASPAYVYASSSPAGLPRELKIVGRNLRPSPGRATQVRLVGPQRFIATTIADAHSSAVVNQYVARMPLPARMTPGRYNLEVNRDGESWVGLRGQVFTVLPDPTPLAEFSVDDPRFGGCHPDDEQDDTGCVVRAIAAAARASGGVVHFGPGTWDLVDSSQPGLGGTAGIVVPPGVQLRGDGSDQTRLQRHLQWNAQAAIAAFTLEGRTSVTGFTFRDLQTYRSSDQAGPYLQLGKIWPQVDQTPGASSAVVSDVIISHNVFDRPAIAIGGGGLPIERLFLTYNTFGAYHAALELSGDQHDTIQAYRIDDSVIDYNEFKPGSDLDVIHQSGTMASELGAGRRLDFSGNTADGSSTDFLYSPDDAKGWRAAFFWSLNNNVEEVLISQNTATCTGDKTGDGEAIAFDNNINTFGFRDLATVVAAGPGTVTIAVPFVAKQHNREIPVASYYIGQFVQIVSGAGLGQVRKITAYSTNPATGRVTISVAPSWDVTPLTNDSRLSVGREYWQLYVVGNHVDNRQPLCQKSNRSRRTAGLIGIWGQSADSVLAGNEQHDSAGIQVQQNFGFVHGNAESIEHPCDDCTAMGFFNYFLEIHDNLVDGEYDWGNDCSGSGIAMGVASAPWEAESPPTVGFGVSISHNTIRRADGPVGGAISQMMSWYDGPAPHRWPLSDSLLIHHNAILDIDGPRAAAICSKSHARMGIVFPEAAITWRTVLYANSCKNVSMPIGGSGVETVKVCPSSAPSSCECSSADK